MLSFRAYVMAVERVERRLRRVAAALDTATKLLDMLPQYVIQEQMQRNQF